MALLGAHMSIAGGVSNAIPRGDELRCEAIQVFVQSSRTWALPPLAGTEILAFRGALDQAKHVRSVIAHNSYLLNISTSNEELRKKSVAYFIELMNRCEALGIEGLITHPGSHLGEGLEAGIRNTIRTLNEVLEACAGFKTELLLENTAGQGACIGCEFEHLRGMVEGCRYPDRIGFCFDTQHAFAAGYDLRTEETFEATFDRFDALLSLKKIRAFHLNDSVKELGCRVDRHEAIGKGHLGTYVFRRLMNDTRFEKVPMCLETAPGEENANWKRELKLLRSFRQSVRKGAAGGGTSPKKQKVSPRDAAGA